MIHLAALWDFKSPLKGGVMGMITVEIILMKKTVLKVLYFVILLGRFPLVGKIKKIFGHFFHIIEVQK